MLKLSRSRNWGGWAQNIYAKARVGCQKCGQVRKVNTSLTLSRTKSEKKTEWSIPLHLKMRWLNQYNMVEQGHIGLWCKLATHAFGTNIFHTQEHRKLYHQGVSFKPTLGNHSNLKG